MNQLYSRQPPQDLAALPPHVPSDPVVPRFEGDDKYSASRRITGEHAKGLTRWFLAHGFVGEQVVSRALAGSAQQMDLPLADFCSTNIGRAWDGRVLTSPKQPRGAIKLMGTASACPSKTVVMAAKLAAATLLAPQRGFFMVPLHGTWRSP